MIFDERLLAVVSDAEVPSASRDDEAKLVALAALHGVSGLALGAVRDGRMVVSPEGAEVLERDWRSQARWSAALDLEASQVAFAARSQDLVKPVVLKGASVARCYAEPSMRTYSDVDLLVPRAQFDSYGEILRSLGYLPLNRWAERTESKFSHHVQYWRRIGEGFLLCELHHSLSIEKDVRGLDYDWIVEAGVDPEPAGLLMPRKESVLLVLAVHLARTSRAERRAIWFRDFLEVVEPDVLASARQIADSHGIGPKLNRALHEVELVVGSRGWSSEPRDRITGLERSKGLDHGRLRSRMALLRELGPLKGAAYLSSRLSPARWLGRNSFTDAP